MVDRPIIASNADPTDFMALPAQARMRPLRLPIVHEAILVPGELKHDSLMAAFRLEHSLMVVPNLAAIMFCV